MRASLPLTPRLVCSFPPDRTTTMTLSTRRQRGQRERERVSEFDARGKEEMAVTEWGGEYYEMWLMGKGSKGKACKGRE